MNMFKKMSANLTPKVLIIWACAFSSLCTTAYVTNVYLLRPIWLSPLVFAGIFAIQRTILRTLSRIFKSAPSFRVILPCVAAAILIIAACRNILFPTQQETDISLTAETAGEICLCDVVVDGENIPVAEACVVENFSWLYREQWDNFMIWLEEDETENRLTLRFLANEVHLGFSYTPYAGSVTIVSSAGNDGGTWDLRCPEWKEGEAVQYADFSFDCRHVYSPLTLLLYSAGILPLISLVCLILYYGAGLVWKKSLLIIDFLVSNNILQYLIIIIIFFLSWIQLELSPTFDNWRDVFTINAKYIAINIMTVCALYLLIHSIVNSLWKSCVIFSIFITLLAVINYYVIEFHGTPLTFMELQNFKTALNVIGGYKFDIKGIDEIIYILCAEIVLCYIIKKTGIKVHGRRILQRRLIKDFCLYIVVFFIIFFTYLSSDPFMNEEIVGAWASSYHQYGYPACTVKLAADSVNFLQKPDGYEKGIDNIEFVNVEHNSRENEQPDIILILNETFYDLSLISNIKTDIPYLENINTLENTITGYAIVPHIGGSTNCSEYELLTSNSLRLMPGITPFNVINMKDANTVVSYLKQLGYYTIAGHPEKGSNYNRINAYADMGLDEYYFYDDFTDRKSYGNKWVLTDKSAYENLLLWMKDHTDTPQFIYLLTIQNHGPWNINERKYDTVHVSNDYGELNEAIDEYMTGIRMSDSAFKYLTDQLKEYNKKVIVCMVGDHSPSFAKDIVDQEHSSSSSLLLSSTPFVIWANFDIEDKDMGSISMNYLIPTLFETAKMPLSQYYQYMLNLMEDVPILMPHAYYDKNMNEYLYDMDSEYTKAINNYFYMEYNNLQKNRRQQFFDVFPKETHKNNLEKGESAGGR
ncbi:MAG: LTA synthase family protein [Lachnospiraceae bacterium]|nr:LTA synthase family protein [Lachnospiraceae bacterium]